VSGWLLALDASTPRCTLALGRADRDDDPLADVEDDGANQASVRLHARIAALCERAGIRAAELGLVACGRGPGTFTGTRVAIATAKGLAIAIGVRIVPVSTLAAVAASLEEPAGCVLAVLDARRGEAYGGWFAQDGAAIAPERIATMAALLASGPRPDHVIGPGVEAYADAIEAAIPRTAIPGPSALGLWRAARAALTRGEGIEPAALDAVYLRESYAELGVNTPRRPTFKSPFV
jgi:tRNA threonylcarbamoyl adenosine modification protein YeaZ